MAKIACPNPSPLGAWKSGLKFTSGGQPVEHGNNIDPRWLLVFSARLSKVCHYNC